MTRTRRLLPCVLLAIGLIGPAGSRSACFAAAPTEADGRADRPGRLGLLVGVQDYPKLGEARQLRGSRNDVRLIEALLVDRFGFRPDDIVTLLDEQATGAAIRREMARLAERVGKVSANGPAQVVFYFSGHGSRVPDQEEGHAECDEEDALDETLVPYDADEEGGRHDVRDDELYRFAQAVCAGGRARLWAVLDCCHSGTGVRGTTTIRRLDRSVVPFTPTSNERRKITPKRLPPEAVVLSACRANEVEPEYRENDQSYGLLTRFLAEVLRGSPEVSTLSYGGLRERIVDRYLRDAVVPAPTPQLEGTAESLRRVVLGAESRMDRKPFIRAEPSGRDGRTVRLAAGAFHGVTIGSLYELYERPGEHERLLAWLEIERIEGPSAFARPFRWTDASQQAKTEIGLARSFERGYAIERYHQHAHGGARLRVVRAVDSDTDGPALGPDDPSVPQAIRGALASIPEPGESQWLTWVEGDADCDLLLRIDGDRAALFPAIGMTSGAPRAERVRGETLPRSLRGGWGPIDLTQPGEARRHLRDYLRRIVRARNLLRVAATQSAASAASAVELELLAVELNDDLEIAAARALAPGADGLRTMRRDDLFAVRVTLPSTAPKPMYVSVLAVDPDMEIHAVLPHQEGVGLVDEQRLEPGTSRTSSPYRCTEPYGPHQAIVLATDRPNDFHLLAQPSLPRTRSAAAGSPLEALLVEHTYFRTRGRRPKPQKSADPTWSATLLRWDATP